MKLHTIGHSSRSIEEFLSCLSEFQITAVADVRRYPGSRKFPHFNRDALRALLEHEGMEYAWFEALGGYRHSGLKEESPNMGLTRPGFRSYADHMMTEAFESAARKLMALGATRPTAIMCAETLYWKCHRRLLSDFLLAQGVAVSHILERGNLRPHSLTPGAVILEDRKVIYP